MGLEFCSFGSGSSGNCYLVRTDDTVLLLDVGLTGKAILAGLDTLGLDACDVNGILLTHEHVDHVRSGRMLGRKAENATVYGTLGTLNNFPDKLPAGRTEPVKRHDKFTVGDIDITVFPVSHDASDPVAYTFESEGVKLSVMTDTGYVNQIMYDNICDSDALVIEANHEVELLKSGPYPYPLKQRILGLEGHLSNETCGGLLSDIISGSKGVKMPFIMLGHLSAENNTPKIAIRTVTNILFEHEHYVERDCELVVAPRSEPSGLIKVVR